MARNEEKQLARLNRFYLQKDKEGTDSVTVEVFNYHDGWLVCYITSSFQ